MTNKKFLTDKITSLQPHPLAKTNLQQAALRPGFFSPLTIAFSDALPLKKCASQKFCASVSKI